MQLSVSSLLLAALPIALSAPTSVAAPALVDRAPLEFQVPFLLSTHTSAGVDTFTFRVNDPKAATVENATSTTICTGTFPTTAPPNGIANAGKCQDAGFRWYFSSYSSYQSFSLNVDHTYFDPVIAAGTGLSVTYFGEGGEVSKATTKKLKVGCSKHGSVCSAEYKEPKNPIIIPITHIIA